jgi:NADH dehydrogenase
MSALGADAESASDYARTKAAGEAKARAAFPGAIVLRPSIVFGPEDNFFNQFAGLSRLAPALPLIGGGHTKFTPLFVGDLAEAVARLSTKASPWVPMNWAVRRFSWQFCNYPRRRPQPPAGAAALDVAKCERYPRAAQAAADHRSGELLKADNVVSGAAAKPRSWAWRRGRHQRRNPTVSTASARRSVHRARASRNR